jgi:hypothetical protein
MITFKYRSTCYFIYDLMDCIFVTQDFLLLLQEKNREMDLEIHFKDTFRAFSKDEDGKQYKIL